MSMFNYCHKQIIRTLIKYNLPMTINEIAKDCNMSWATINKNIPFLYEKKVILKEIVQDSNKIYWIINGDLIEEKVVKPKLKKGDIVEVKWSSDLEHWICPICGFHNSYAYYTEISLCENCESAFEELQCLKIIGIQRVKENGIKLEVKN